MPSLDYVQEENIFYFCVHCVPKIIHALSNGTTMNANLDHECDTYGGFHKGVTQAVCLPFIGTWFSFIKHRWRLSNDCRRFVIRDIIRQ